jgi:circadian clock protein KaiC
MSAAPNAGRSITLPKIPTGIQGFDEITNGGLPVGRTTLVCGGPGTGKTLFALEFLLRGIAEWDEPAVCMTFEETPEELSTNLGSLGYDLKDLVKKKKLVVDHVRVERREIEETGAYDLEGLFIRLGHAIDTIGARRVVLDTIEVLFYGLQNTAVVRSELRRLFRWLKEKGVTSMVTSETGAGSLTRHGLEEYVADCVIMLDHRVSEQVSTRRLRIMKYRGSTHGTNEYPFIIDARGVAVVPITSAGLTHEASSERIPSGVAGLDEMLAGQGFYIGSSILLSGTAGTGKSSFAAHFAGAAARAGEKALYFAFEESPSQILRNMRSLGLDLQPVIDQGLLRIEAHRPTSSGLEAHLAAMQRCIGDANPDVVVVDPITNLISIGDQGQVKSMLTRLIDFLKTRGITAMFSTLMFDRSLEETTVGISSLMDTWVMLRDVETPDARRKRLIHVLKARGMAHSNQIREFTLGDKGIRLLDFEGGGSTPKKSYGKASRNGQPKAKRKAA